MTLQTRDYKHWSIGLEVGNVTAVIDNYNDLTNTYNGSDSIVVDPEGTDVNQASYNSTLKK